MFHQKIFLYLLLSLVLVAGSLKVYAFNNEGEAQNRIVSQRSSKVSEINSLKERIILDQEGSPIFLRYCKVEKDGIKRPGFKIFMQEGPLGHEEEIGSIGINWLKDRSREGIEVCYVNFYERY